MRVSTKNVQVATLALAAVLLLPGLFGAQAGPDLTDDWRARTNQAKFGLLEAIERALKVAKEGVPCEVELEPDKGTLVYSVDLAQGKRTRNVVLSALTGEVVEDELEGDDRSAKASAVKAVGLAQAIEAATKTGLGKPFYAGLMLRNGALQILVILVGEDGKVVKVWVDGATGVARQEGAKDEPAFTDTFAEDKADLGPTGRNAWFCLEPGRYWILEGKDEGKTLRVTCRMLSDTKTIDGVECRALEVREELDGELIELTRDYHAISRRTGNVYYFGEDVDVLEDGKVVGHEGAWLSGENGARYGLFVPAVPLLGSRYYQEIAPNVAMDRAEILGIDEVVETPAGTFRGVLHFVETNPLEPGHEDHKYLAPEVGFIVKEEENLVLVEHGRR
jgi:uncharacterized membrane protein YkoI